MSFIEFIGFIISFGAFIFLIIRRVFQDIHRKRHPEQYPDEEFEDQQEQDLEEFLRTLDIEPEVKKAPPPPPKKNTPPIAPQSHSVGRRVPDEFAYQSGLERRTEKNRIESRKIKVPLASYEYQTAFKDLDEAPEYETMRRYKNSRARALLTELPSMKSLVIINEIFGKPKGFE